MYHSSIDIFLLYLPSQFSRNIMFQSRYRRITVFFARLILSVIAWELILPRIGFRSQSKNTRSERLRKMAVKFRAMAIDMGGVMIKLGQFLSTRADVLPQEITSELAGLQDEVPAESFESVRLIVENEYKTPITEKFYQFAKQPLAAASLGQAHRAILFDNDAHKIGFKSVVVKILRPDIEIVIETDLSALKRVAGWVQKYRPISRRADIPALFREFSKTLYEEIDYQAEAQNAEIFAINFKDRPGVCIPRVVWSLCTTRVLVLEDVSAIKISDYKKISAAGIDLTEVAQRLFETYLQQIFRDGFFHADPHPGNLFVAPVPTGDKHDPNNSGWVLTFIDFGMVGRVPPNIKTGLREMVIGVGTRDASRVINSYQMLGVLLPHADLEMIEAAEEKIFEQFWGKSMQELQQIDVDEVRKFAGEYRELLYEMPIQVPDDILYLGRCVAILSGMCTGLNPDFNVWKGLTPFAQELIQEESGDIWEQVVTEITTWGSLRINLPRRVDKTLTKLESGKISVRNPDLERRLGRIERTNRRLIGAVVFTALLTGGIQLALGDAVVPAIIMIVISAIILAWVIMSGNGSSR
jgi:predicted unusual protein kinase regulating ubiquinone biosynthesis (AarF/ABC1/UbiB family)